MCGVVGLIGTPEAAREAFLGLTTLQHRGQDAAGILSYDAGGFHKVKNIGLVEAVFTRENMENLTGNMAIGHARYSTVGKTGDTSDVQPLVVSAPFGLGLIHNGNIVNHRDVAADLKRKHRRNLLTHSDSEVVLNLFAEGLAQTAAGQGKNDLTFDDICSAAKMVFTGLNGSYSVVTMVADHGLVAFRDPYGIRPLVWGRRPAMRGPGAASAGEAFMIASESVALSFMGYEQIQDLRPGEVLFIDLKGNVHSKVLDHRGPRHCMFEWVYFASPESVIDGVPVYGARINLGKNLAKLVKTQIQSRGLQPDIVVPVPETSRIAAIALSEELGIPYREVLIKNRYIKRTFILDSQEKRQKAVNLKLSPVRSEIQGKRVLLVDDSIVRGTTSRKIVELVRNAGAKSVYFVSTCPPIKHPCYYGIDFPMESELIASGRDNAAIEKELGVDAVIYQDLDGLRRSIQDASESRGSRFEPCMACLDGKYPTDVSTTGVRFAAERRADRGT
ncbi:MAG TPA: amidophosphoribosyltransferase [Bdellovibrionota bacterium]|nr:amidophosphoribosyltransferase [Bdellovibrionota bacterium]